MKGMLKKMRESMKDVCVKSHCKKEEFKADENAMEVIQVVMIIAVGVIAIAAVWAGVNGLLAQWWEQIVGVQAPPPITLPTGP